MKVIRALRVHQWLKNLLIFAPLISLGEFEYNQILTLINLFFGFSITVSSTYIINDLIDIDSDKNHPVKKFRPIAAGILSKKVWIVISILLFFVGSIWIFVIDNKLLIISISYCILSLSYSLKLKYLKYIDLITISILFTMRIIFGALPFSIPLSKELSLFVFFTSITLISGKKMSILNNLDISTSKIKNYLLSNYVSNELKKIMIISSIISSSTFFSWITYEKRLFVTNSQFYALNLSFFSLIIFNYLFVYETFKNNTEDIFFTVRKSKKLLVSIFVFITFAIIGIL